MTQELFRERIEIHRQRKAEELKRKLFGLWKSNAESYRCLIQKYEALLEKKKGDGADPTQKNSKGYFGRV